MLAVEARTQRVQTPPNSAARAAAMASNTGCTSVGDSLMTFRISAVAVCRSSASWVSLNRRTFSIAITAWSAKVCSSAISLARERARRPRAAMVRQPIAVAVAQQRHEQRRAVAAARSPVCVMRRHVSAASRVSATCTTRAVENAGAGASCRGPAARARARRRAVAGAGRRRRSAWSRSCSPSTGKTDATALPPNSRWQLSHDGVEHRLRVGRASR